MSDPDRKLWEGMLAYLRANHPTICRQWFEEIEPLGVSGGALNLRAHSNVHRDYLRRQCLEPFSEAVQQVADRLISVRFLGPEDEIASDGKPQSRTRTARPGEAAAPIPESLTINPDYDFSSFVVGPGNRYAHAAAIAVANKPGHAYNPLFIHGKVGLGKTHLLQAVCLKIKESHPETVIQYLSCESFVSHFTESIREGWMTEFRHAFRDVDVLVIDDIHFLGARVRSQEEFFHTFNTLYQANKQIVLSSDAPPEHIPDLEERLVSRFKWGLVSEVEPPDYETRVAILKTKAKMRGLDLPEDVACHIAARVDTNIRELEGAVTKLQLRSVVEGRPIDLEIARAALGENTAPTTSGPTIQAIIDAVTEFYSVRLTDLQSKRRQRSIALPRQVCMYLARRHTRHSLEEIGGYFGGRDHTTVMHAVRTVDEKRGVDQDFEHVLQALEGRLRDRR
ncbi:MAG: chromosomal replication initiator protein DnaA [Phycisphaeraceae bacterium]|nr:chromosomal replication initiator protein DnaA [Phycisphaeraceae bacterium]MCW5754791.1 chromosomal replication initiator protein DnaA [Phycisphaeraceae bacterium]